MLSVCLPRTSATRRALLGALGLAVVALALATPRAQAVQDQPVLAGQTNTASLSTRVTTTGSFGLIGETTSSTLGQYGVAGINLVGTHAGSGGVLGVGYIGVSGSPPLTSPVPGSIGVRGTNNHPNGRAGVAGFADDGVGVEGGSFRNAGVRGQSYDGPGVLAINEAGGLALDVVGRVRLSRSGVTTIPVGEATATVPVRDIDASSVAFAISQTASAGVVVAAVEPDPEADTIEIVLDKRAKPGKPVRVAWFVLG